MGLAVGEHLHRVEFADRREAVAAPVPATVLDTEGVDWHCPAGADDGAPLEPLILFAAMVQSNGPYCFHFCISQQKPTASVGVAGSAQ